MCTFQFKTKFFTQIVGCPIGGPLAFALSDIQMTRAENKVVKAQKP